ncbi:hypothetical protein KIH45_13115, partial [Croceicoccus sp. 1NDH52]|nr:hypothetical protein [Croceicoccus gelatinilyticus]
MNTKGEYSMKFTVVLTAAAGTLALAACSEPAETPAETVVGSGLVDHSQKSTVAARVSAEKKTVG